ncbi:MAG: hypothetical protein CMD08_03325 [Flavobacteriales bacterium]|nr:hypothetical protein [Flavobacteriales bacterium]
MKKSSLNKIAVFSPFLNPVGVKRATFGLSKKFSENGYHVDMLSIHKEWEDLNFSQNMNLIYLSKLFKNFPTKGYLIFRTVSILVSLRTVFAISNYIKKNNPNILFVSMMPFVAWLGLKLSGKSDVKFVVSIQGYPRNNLFRRIAWKKVFKSADRVITESKSLQNLISEMTNSYKNLSYIYNPHFEKQDEFKIKSKNMNEFGNYIIGLGRLTKQKNFRLLISAFSKINFIKDTKLVIVGNGEERNYLNKLVKRLDKENPEKKLSSKIIFTGELKEPLNYIKNAKMIVIPSLWEGLPRVAIEAQALKTPIISACSKGGLGEILLDGNAGILTIPDDENDLINAITLYERDESLTLKHTKEGFENIDRFSLKSSSNKYLKVFSEL